MVKRGNNLILIEKGQLSSYDLDDRNVWQIGRPSKDNIPDIKLHSSTVSRRHGKFQNMDGCWLYMDLNGKNGTVYNHKYLGTGIKGRIKPVMLNNGDTFVFGGGKEEAINGKTIWGMFLTSIYEDNWQVIDSKQYNKLKFVSGEETIVISELAKGLVIEKESGIAIYMGDLTYTNGNMEVIGC